MFKGFNLQCCTFKRLKCSQEDCPQNLRISSHVDLNFTIQSRPVGTVQALLLVLELWCAYDIGEDSSINMKEMPWLYKQYGVSYSVYLGSRCEKVMSHMTQPCHVPLCVSEKPWL
jgi:hypothetical protein